SPEAERSELRDLSRLAKLERLRALDLSRTPINAKGLEAVARIPRLRELRLVLARNIDDAAAPVLASMKLEALYLAGTGLTDAGLAKLHDAKSLRMLTLGSTKVTAAAVEEFRRARPDCVVIP
ncbi:MAG: hypothetical protein ACRD96_04635, partial [Bryobacteraceae bacterium]